MSRKPCAKTLQQARIQAIKTAQEWLALPDGFVLLDAETTGLGPSARFVQLSIMDSDEQVLFDELIRPANPEAVLEKGKSGKSAYDIHGIGPEQLKDALTFAEHYPQIKGALEGRVVVIYNMAYDWPMLEAECQDYGLEVPEVAGLFCAMVEYAAFCGEWNSYFGNFKYQPLEGGDHSALGDCRATLAVIKRMAEHG